MNFNSLQYFLFLPCVVVIYYLLPYKRRNIFLLICSYFFYMRWEARYALLMLTSTAATYLCARLVSGRFLGRRRLWLVLSLVVNLLILFFFKYFNFFSTVSGRVFMAAGLDFNMPHVNVLLPVGISFYTFQALGYTIDVYRNNVAVERSFADYALFVSFFPQLVAGPIERSSNLLPQLKERHTFSLENMHAGLLLFFWGLFKKLVIADNLAAIVNHAFDAPPGSVGGIQYAVAAAFFSMQIYCDFSAYSDIARGSAIMLGFKLMRNFSAPYLAESIRDFWRRWHISLSTWFKDYLYFPLGGSKCGRLRNYANLMAVFLISGLWHGAALTFICWGFLHGAYQIASVCTERLRARILERLGIDRRNPALGVLRRLVTFAFVTAAFIFFRAGSVSQALYIIKSIAISPLSAGLLPAFSELSIPKVQLAVVFCAAAVCFIVDYMSERQRVRLVYPAARYGVYFALITAALVFGCYGGGYDPLEFIYFQF